MKKILAIGGAVIKTAHKQLEEVIKRDEVEMLIHNGGSLFHDFQIGLGEIDVRASTSYPLTELIKSFDVNKPTSDVIWQWLDNNRKAPIHSISGLCERKGIPVLTFTVMGADFWHMFGDDWKIYAQRCQEDFETLAARMRKDPFHFINMGSAVIHPEIFLKAIAVSQPEAFKADVVDFLEMYRPRTRVAPYGEYYKMTHQEFFLKWINGEI